jgi:hypothetical protein
MAGTFVFLPDLPLQCYGTGMMFGMSCCDIISKIL